MKFGSVNFEPAQQGDLDGFCGIYSALNFIFRRLGWRKHDDRQRQRMFERFLNLLHDREKFTVQRVARSGFRWGQIRAAFHKLSKAEGLQLKAVSLKAHAKKVGATNVFDLLLTLEKNEAAMIHLDLNEDGEAGKVGHWILAHSAAGSTFLVDGSSREPKVRKYGPKEIAEYKINLEEGLVFLNA